MMAWASLTDNVLILKEVTVFRQVKGKLHCWSLRQKRRFIARFEQRWRSPPSQTKALNEKL